MSNFTLPKDFYPTPESLIKRMVDKLGVDYKRRIKYILEPSAGRGDLIDGYIKQYESGQNINGYWMKGNKANNLKIDTIELDENLINVLRGKGYNVVFNDFLEFNPVRFYDLIIANFPFSNGVKHFLKAIEIQGRTGGEILAIINAETIKNTYSKERLYLKQQLDMYEADIEFIENAFVDADRETEVEIALVYVKIPMIKTESMFEREFKKDNPQINFEDINGLTVKMNKLQQLVFEYDLVVKSITKLFEEKMRIDKLLEGFGIDGKISICNDQVNPKVISINDFINDTNMRFWDRFITETSFETRLPSKLRDSFRMNMQKQQNIAFNMDNIQYFYNELMNSIPKSYEETIGDLFDAVTRKYNYTDNEFNKNIWGYNGWKSNDAYAIKKKCIIPCYLSSSYYSYNIPNELIDLNIAFNNITGIKDEDSFKYNSDVIKQIKDAGKKIETTHFILNSYKKGTLHIEFKDRKALAMFNYLGAKGKNWVGEGFGTKNYSDMTKEEQEIVKGMGFEPIEYQELTGQKDYLRLMEG